MDDQQRIMSMMVLAEDQQKAAQAAIDDLKAQQAALSDLAQGVQRAASQAARSAVHDAMSETIKGASAALDAGARDAQEAAEAAKTAAEAFPAVVGRVGWRITLIGAVAALLVVLIVAGAGALSLTWQQRQVDALRQQRADLVDEVASLKAGAEAFAAKAGKAQLTTCGDKRRLCVLVDTKAGTFGGGDATYVVIKGY